jgi:hypothetical protein
VTAGGPVASWLRHANCLPASARNSFHIATIKTIVLYTIRTFALSVSQNFEYCAFGTGSCDFRAPKRVQCMAYESALYRETGSPPQLAREQRSALVITRVLSCSGSLSPFGLSSSPRCALRNNQFCVRARPPVYGNPFGCRWLHH